ncbi:MAG: hypothetical protein KKC99_08175 [Proteobacteria bacterium]|nr:hypothetical protein [Pseudomonadota bacterium]
MARETLAAVSVAGIKGYSKLGSMGVKLVSKVLPVSLAALFLTLVLLAVPAAAAAEDISRAFGITLGEPLPLSSKQVQGMGSPGHGLEQYMLLFVPAPRPPYARYYATIDVATRRVARITGRSRKVGTPEQTWQAFDAQVEKLEKRYGAGMRLGGGAIWRRAQEGRSIVLTINPDAGLVQVQYADERRLRLGLPQELPTTP